MADTYGTVAEADAYFTDRGQAYWLVWDALSANERLAALIRAACYIDARYAGRWRGRKADFNQDRAWPRAGAVDGEAFDIPSDAIPGALKHAAFEAAIADIRSPGALSGAALGAKRVIRRKVGNVETQFADDGGASATEATGRLVDTLLTGVLTSASNLSTSFLLRA